MQGTVRRGAKASAQQNPSSSILIALKARSRYIVDSTYERRSQHIRLNVRACETELRCDVFLVWIRKKNQTRMSDTQYVIRNRSRI